MSPLLRPLRSFADRRFARKLAVARGACLALLVGLEALVVASVADGTMQVSVSRTSARFAAPSALRTVAWSDAPVAFVLHLVVHLAIAAALVAALYVVLARIVERTHGRRILPFRRRYPY